MLSQLTWHGRMEEYDLDDIDLEDLSEAILSEFKQSVIEYITGYVCCDEALP